MKLPFVLRQKYEAVRLENFTLRTALRDANAELLKHRALLAGLRAGDERMTVAVERAIRA